MGNRFFVDSETGTLTDVLLCPPDFYEWVPHNAVTRQSMTSLGGFDIRAARAQFTEFEQAFAEAGVTCHYLAPDSFLPDQLYTRDPGLVTPWGPVILQPMQPRRRGEVAPVVDFFDRAGAVRWRWATAGSVEGGDIHMVRPGLLVIGYSGERTTIEGARQVGDWYRGAGWEVRYQNFPEHFLHFDLLFAMVADALAVACVEALPDDYVAWLAEKKVDVIPVSYGETMRLGCNPLSLGDDRVISSSSCRELNRRLRDAGIEVLDPDISVFTGGGGGPRCMSMALRREPLGG